MGASAGTGMNVRRFEEGGSTSSPATPSSPAPQRAVYRPQYTDYSAGLPTTPKTSGFLSSIIGKNLPSTAYQNSLPTFNRPSVDQSQTPSYRIPFGIPSKPNPFSSTPEQQAAKLGAAIQEGNLNEGQYELMMADPGKYLSYVQAVQAGNAPETIGYQQKPIQYMTAAQRDAYNKKMQNELDQIIRPITVFPEKVYTE